MVDVLKISSTRAKSSQRARRVKLVGLLAGVALTAAACGSSAASGTNSTTAPTSAPTTASPGGGGASIVAVSTATVGGGTALVNSKGFTLYTYSLDKPGKIACISSACVSTWPPLLVP